MNSETPYSKRLKSKSQYFSSRYKEPHRGVPTAAPEELVVVFINIWFTYALLK